MKKSKQINLKLAQGKFTLSLRTSISKDSNTNSSSYWWVNLLVIILMLSCILILSKELEKLFDRPKPCRGNSCLIGCDRKY